MMAPPPIPAGAPYDKDKSEKTKVDKKPKKKKKDKKSKLEKRMEDIVAFNSNPQRYVQTDDSYPLKSFIENRRQELAVEAMDEVDREIFGVPEDYQINQPEDNDFERELKAPVDEIPSIEDWEPGDKLMYKGFELDEIEADFIMSNKMENAKVLHPIYADVLEGDKIIYGYKFLEKYPILHHITDEETVKYFLHGASKKAGLIESELTLEQELQCANDNNIVLHLSGADISYERYGYDYANDFPALSLAELVMAEYNIGLIEHPRGLKLSEKITDKMDLFCKFKPTLTDDEQKRVIGMAYYTREKSDIDTIKVKYNNRLMNLWLSKFNEEESTYANDYALNYIYEQYWINAKYKDFINSSEAEIFEIKRDNNAT